MRRSAWIGIGLSLIIGIYLTYSCFGIAAPFLWGHHGYHGATYAQRARMTLRYQVVTPANWIGYSLPPQPQSYYLHHPIGYHHLLVPILRLAGDREWVIRGAAALFGIPLILALFFLTRRLWSAPAGLCACAVYVALPILCSFSILSDPMLPAMACCILTAQAFLRYQQEPRWRFLILGCAALIGGGLLMWEAYFQAFFYGLYAIYWMFGKTSQPMRLGRWNAPRMWFLCTFLCSSATMAFHFLFTWKVGMLGDFFSSFAERHAAQPAWVLFQHWKWLSLLYGLPILCLGMLWLLLFLRRLFLGQGRLRDQAVLICFLINTLYIVLFAKGSAIHLYRVFWFSTFLALAVTDLLCDGTRFVRQILSERCDHPGAAFLAKGLPAVAIVVYFALVLPHAYHNLVESRAIMGTHGHANYDAEYTKLLFAQAVAQRTALTDYAVNLNLSARIEFGYYLDRSPGILPWGGISSLAQIPAVLKAHPRTVLIAEDRLPKPEQAILCDLLKHHRGFLFDRFLLILLYDQTPEFTAYRFVATPPSPAWRFWVSHKYPPMHAELVSTVYDKCLSPPKPPKSATRPPR